MLKKRSRLSRGEFITAFKGGIRVRVPGASLVRYPRDTTKLSVVVSKKVARLATDRNRLRRQLYASLKTPLGGLQGMYIVMLSLEAQKMTIRDLTAAITPGLISLSKRGSVR